MPSLTPTFTNPPHLGTPLDPLIWKKKMSCPNWDISFGPNGEIQYLMSKSTNRVWFDSQKNANIIQFVHTTYTAQDINQFVLDYGKCGGEDCPIWYLNDFGKNGLINATTVHATWVPTTQQVYELSPCIFSLQASMSNSNNIYGPPKSISLITNLTDPNMIQFTLNWYNKTATRLPEAFWFSVKPSTFDPYAIWTIDKVGEKIPANSVVINGSQHLHGHWKGVEYSGLDGDFEVNAIDSGLVSLGLRSPFPTPLDKPPNPADGLHFLLWNNIWATNFPLWYPYQPQDANCAFRFQFVVN